MAELRGGQKRREENWVGGVRSTIRASLALFGAGAGPGQVDGSSSLGLAPSPAGGVAGGGRSGEVKKKRRRGLSGRERREGEKEKLRENKKIISLCNKFLL